MREPVPSPSASRGWIPPEPPTAVGLMERPEWGLPREPQVAWWARLLLAFASLFTLFTGRRQRRSQHQYGYYGRVPIGIPDEPR